MLVINIFHFPALSWRDVISSSSVKSKISGTKINQKEELEN